VGSIRSVALALAWALASASTAVAGGGGVAGAGDHARADVAPAALRDIGGDAMGSTWRLRWAPGVDGPAPEALRAELQALFDGIEAELSLWRADSTIRRFNDAAPGEAVAMTPHFRAVLEHALALHARSGGAFDPTAGPLVQAWGFGAGPARSAAPDAETLAAARARLAAPRLRAALAAADGDAALVQPGGVALDLNAATEGHALDAAAAYLRACGVDAFVLELSREFIAAGRRPDGQPWRIGIEWPERAAPDGDADARVRPDVVALRDLALATSGDAHQAFVAAGRRHGHVIDPRTGAPTAHGLAQASVLHPSAREADGLATTLMVLGPDAGLAFAEAQGLAALLLVRGDDGLRWRATAAWRAQARAAGSAP
jgi:thiamine biosynthesis lipoprotein